MIRQGPSRALRRAASAAVALALGLAAESAHAAPPAKPPAPHTAAGAPATASNPQAVEDASTHFKRGLRVFDEGDYTLALVEFERAYQLAPNYRALYNIALVNMQLGRYADAARTFEKYLHDGGNDISPTRAAEVKRTLAELKLRTATVDVSTSVPGSEVTLDGKPLDATMLKRPLEIDAGEHTLRAAAPGYLTAVKTVTLAGGDRSSVRLVLEAIAPARPAEAPTHAHAIFWPGFAATGALAVGAIVSGAIMLDARSHLAQLQDTPSDPGTSTQAAADRASTANRANTAALAADIMTGLAVVAGGVSLYLSLGPDHTTAPTIAVSLQRVAVEVPF